jgi:hypothetical protein
MKKYRNIVILILSVISTIISIIAICRVCPNTSELGLDYQGIIVGILALLVTVLIGWQIFSVIDIRKIKDDVLNMNMENYIRSERNSVEIQMSLSQYYLDRGLETNDRIAVFKYLLHSISTIVHQERINDINGANAMINTIISSVSDPNKILLTQVQKNSLIELIFLFRKNHDIHNTDNLLSLVTKMEVKD